MAYDATTPSDSSVLFQAHTANTIAGLASSAPKTLATAKAIPAPDTQKCGMGGPSPCPIDLYASLGAANAKGEYLELIATLNPSTDKASGSKLNKWQITYSCQWSE